MTVRPRTGFDPERVYLEQWNIDYGNMIETIYLLTPEQFESLPDNSIVISIFGDEKVKGVDRIDRDTRFGYLAYGLSQPFGS